MSKALALFALTVLSSVYAAEVPQPSWTNHNRISGSQQMMTNFKPWAESIESTLDGKATKTELADRYRIKSEMFTNDVSAVVTNDVGRWDISGTPKAQSYYWIYFDPDHPFAFLMDGNETISECPYTQGMKTLHFTRSYNLDPIDIKARLITENALGLAYSKDIPAISASDPTFSNAVLSVGLNVDTNSVAVLNEIAATFGGFPIEGTATTVGGLLAALAAAIAWLKKNKVGSFASVGGASATVENGVAKLDDFFTNSNSLLNARITYSRNETGLKDRAFNALTFDGTEYNLSTALAAVTPTASGQPRDLLIVATATAATTISFTAGTIKGDKPTIDGSGTWLITLTEYASGVWYCRQIKMEDAA